MLPSNLVLPHSVVCEEYEFLSSFGTPRAEIAKRLGLSESRLKKIVNEKEVDPVAPPKKPKKSSGFSDNHDIFSTLHTLPVPSVDDGHRRSAALTLAGMAYDAEGGKDDLRDILEMVFQKPTTEHNKIDLRELLIPNK